MDIEHEIRKVALENAVKFKGKANPKALIGRIVGLDPSLKNDIKSVMEKISTITEEVNSLSAEQQVSQLNELGGPQQKETQKKGDLKELSNIGKKVVMRFAPSPSGPMHLGHAMTGGITSLYTKKYKGTFILRIEDTNPENIYPPAYDLLPEDGNWVFGNISDVWIQSERMEIYYEYIEKFLELEKVYICTCSQEEFKVCTTEMKDCPCRNLSKEEQKKRWKKMLIKEEGYVAGDAVLRFKSDMQHKNPAMRDFPLARINETGHPKQGTKYRVWPLMNLSVTVDDIEAGMTHIIRGKDHMDNAKRQELMYQALEKPIPVTYFQGRINFDGIDLSCSKTKARIETGEFEGWDDIRLPFLGALRRRGYQPESFMRFVKEVGLSQADKTVTVDDFFKSLNAHNKDIIEPIARRFFFIENPVDVTIIGAPENNITLDLHPDNEKGGREFNTNQEFRLSKEDIDKMQDSALYRLIDCINIKKDETKKSTFSFVEGDYESFREQKGKQVIHWLPKEHDSFDVEILMPDKTTKTGIAESHLKIIKLGDIIQFERVGFCRLDAIEESDNQKVYKFWFAHK
jgi:glutamyl-tRNA synthetase